MITQEQLASTFNPVLNAVEQQATIAEGVLDRERYMLLVATIWANVVLNPDEAGLTATELEPVHDFLDQKLKTMLGSDSSLTGCYRFIASKQGEAAMKAAQLTSTHHDLLTYFSSMILDPEGHRRWMEQIEADDLP